MISESVDRIGVDVLPDGTVRLVTGAVSAANHTSAARFVAHAAQRLGGPVTRRRPPTAPPLPAAVRDTLVSALADALVEDFRATARRP